MKAPSAFFAALRTGRLLGPVLTASEVTGCNALLAACANDNWPVAFTAYGFATAYHETAGTMQPVEERGGNAYLVRMYDIAGARPDKARELGNLVPGDGVRFCGRGYAQLTGRKNYLRAGTALGVDLIAAPERACEPGIAAAIMVRGMREGWFTGRDLADDLPTSGPAARAGFVASRDIINGRDRAELIADEALAFQAALQAGGWK